jgi:hypothetical protein
MTVLFSITLRDMFYRPVLAGHFFIENLQSGSISSGVVDNQSGVVRISVMLDYARGPTLFSFSLSGNLYVTNCSWTTDILVWSLPSIDMIGSSVLGYASPGQEVEFVFRIHDHQSNLSQHTAILTEPSGVTQQLATDENGLVHFTFPAPLSQGNYSISITATNDTLAYILPTTQFFSIIVSHIMPLQVILEYYTTRPALQEVYVVIVLSALNGSLLEGIVFHYRWLHVQGAAISSSDGLVELHLPVPGEPGIHSLVYDVPASRLILGTTGTLMILVALGDTLASQGIGIAGITLSLLLSLMIGLLPLVRQRYVSS